MTFTPEIAAMRWGYGLPLPDGAPVDAQAMLGLLSGPDSAGATRCVPEMTELALQMERLRLGKQQSKTDPSMVDAVNRIDASLTDAMYSGILATFARAIDSPDGLRERLVQFWADHFSTTTVKSPYFALFPLAQVEDAIRPNLTGRFADLLKAAVLHPAMVTYLDQWRSAGPNSRRAVRRGAGLNENLARELLELHSLGSDAGFAQADVYQTAELLTGLTFEVRDGAVVRFDPNRVEPGPEWILGQKYAGEGTGPIYALLDDLARHPATARHIARKLIGHFITDAPEPDAIAAVEQAFNDSGGDLLAVYGALLNLGAASRADPGKVRQPFDFMVAAFRALGVSGADLAALDRRTQWRILIEPLIAMGQAFKAPRGPDGAPEVAEAWVTPQGLVSRLNWVLGLLKGPERLDLSLDDPAALARRALGLRAAPALLTAVAGVDDRAEAAALVLISPSFNRR